jgi:hypothetical protein
VTAPVPHGRPDADREQAPSTLRVHERLEGHGEAYDGELPIAELDYLLKDVEEKSGATSTLADMPPKPLGQRNIYGVVTTTRAGVLSDRVGSALALQLQDGRWLAFTVAKVLGPQRYLIQGLGPVR